MAQLHFTLDSDFFVGLFSETKDEAFGKLMEALLNQVLQAESTEQLGANNYERSQERSDYRNGTRTRSLTTRIGKIELQVPRHRNVPFKTSLFENYQRNEQALITTMMEMVVQGISTRNVKLKNSVESLSLNLLFLKFVRNLMFQLNILKNVYCRNIIHLLLSMRYI